MKILCVDDDPVYLLVLKATIIRLNTEDELFFIDSGEKALEIVATHHIDLVITDLNLPGISGLDILREAKKHNPAIEVFMISGLATLNEAIEAIKSGARDFLLKPLNPAMITEKISIIRDLFDRRKEAEDYRLAKEAIEQQAQHSICQLETNNVNFISLFNDIQTVINANDIDSEKIGQIRTLISKVTNADNQQN